MRKKKMLAIFTSLFVTFSTCMTLPIRAEEQKIPDSPIGAIESKSVVLMEASTGKLLYEKNAHERLRPASVTKIMTMLLTMEAVDSGKIKLTDTVTTSPNAAGMGGSQVYLEPGEQLTVEEMLKCVGIQSGNDAAVALGEHIAGSEPAFVDLMNKKAQALGMKDTTFKNPCGLDAEDHLTSAYDIAVMSRELLVKHPSISKYLTIWQDKIVHKTQKGEKPFTLSNTNKLIKWYNGAEVLGLKTGFTQAAGYCFSGAAKKNGLTLIAVNMGHTDVKKRFHEIMRLLDWGFANYSVGTGEPKGTIKAKIKVIKGLRSEINAVVKQDSQFLFSKDTKDKLRTKIVLYESELKAPVKKDQVLGQLIYMTGDKEVGIVDLVAQYEIPKITYGSIYKILVKRLFNIY